MATLPVTLAINADLDRNGSYETDLRAYVTRDSGGLKISRGLNRFGEYKVSSLEINLDNSDGRFTPEYTSGAYYGKLGPDIPVQVQATHNSLTYTLWTGYTQEWRVSGRGPTSCRAAVTCADIGKYLLDSDPIHVNVSTARRTDQMIGAVLDAMGLAAGDRDLDTGQETLAYSFAIAQKAMDAIMAGVRSEMGGLAWVTADGKVRFEARNSRLGTTADATWQDGTNVQAEAIAYELSDAEVVSTVRVRGTRYATGQDGTEIFRFSRGMASKPTADSMALTAGQVWERDVPTAAYIALVTPVARTDYLANDAANGSGTDRTSNLTVTVTARGAGNMTLRLVNGHSGTIYVTMLRVRGQPVAFYTDRPEAIATKAITGRKAGSEAALDVPFAQADSTRLRDYAYGSLFAYRMAYPRLVCDFAWSHDDTIVAMLTAELGDLIGFTDKGDGFGNAAWVTNVEDLFYVEAIEHTITPATVGRSRVTLIPAWLYWNLDAIEFDMFDRDDAAGGLGVSTSGATWAGDTGFDIASNKARPNATGFQLATLGNVSANLVVNLSLSNMNADADLVVGFAYRYTDGNNYWRLYVSKGASQLVLQKIVAGVTTTVANPAFTPGDTAEIVAVVQGNRHRIYVDRLLYVDTQDAALNTQQGVGLVAQNTTSTTFDDFLARGV